MLTFLAILTAALMTVAAILVIASDIRSDRRTGR